MTIEEAVAKGYRQKVTLCSTWPSVWKNHQKGWLKIKEKECERRRKKREQNQS